MQGRANAPGTKGLKYQAELDKCADSPCAKSPRFQPRNRKGCFRFLHSDPSTNKDFVPFAYTKYGKLFRGRRNCSHYALSFFDSMDALMEKWKTLRDREDADDRYGNYAGSIDLTEDDGLMGMPSKQAGHFDLHEYVSGPEFAPRVAEYTPLPFPERPKTISSNSHRVAVPAAPGIPGRNDRGDGHAR